MKNQIEHIRVYTDETVFIKKPLRMLSSDDKVLYWDYDSFLINGYLSIETIQQLVQVLKSRADFQVLIDQNRYYHSSEVSQLLASYGVDEDQIIKIKKIDQNPQKHIVNRKLIILPKFLLQFILLIISPVVFLRIILFSLFTKIFRANSRCLDLFRFTYHLFNQIVVDFIWHKCLKKFLWGIVFRKIIYAKIASQFIRRHIYGNLIHRFIYGQLICTYIYGVFCRRYIYRLYYVIFIKSINTICGYRFVILSGIKYYLHTSFLFLFRPVFKIYWFFEYQLSKLRKKKYG